MEGHRVWRTVDWKLGAQGSHPDPIIACVFAHESQPHMHFSVNGNSERGRPEGILGITSPSLTFNR